MPDDLSWLHEEFNERLLEQNDTPRVEVYLNGARYVRELMPGPLEPEDCDIRTRRCLWCWLFGHKDPSPNHVGLVAVCACGALAAYVTDVDVPAGRFVHVGRCRRCNVPYFPRARIAR